MNYKIIKFIDSFPVVTKSEEKFEIFVHQEFFIGNTFGCAPQEIPGLKFYSTSDKRKVNIIDENTYEIDQNIIAKRIKPRQDQ